MVFGLAGLCYHQLGLALLWSAVVSLALLVMVIYGLLWLAWLDCGLWHRYGGQRSARLGKALLCSLLGFAMADLVWLRFGVAPLWLAMVDLALLWLTWLVFGLAWHHNGRQWLAWLGFSMVGLCYG